MMNSRVAWILVAAIGFVACQPQKQEINFPKTDLSAVALIPKPVKTVATNSAFALDAGTSIFTTQNNPGFESVAKFLSYEIKAKTGLELGVNSEDAKNPIERVVYINQSDSEDLKTPESYQLYVKKDSIFLNAKTAAGAFRGIQTLRQLIPEQTNDTLVDHPLWLIPTGKIIDEPRYAYRGSMLDVARHFFTVEEVKKIPGYPSLLQIQCAAPAPNGRSGMAH